MRYITDKLIQRNSHNLQTHTLLTIIKSPCHGASTYVCCNSGILHNINTKYRYYINSTNSVSLCGYRNMQPYSCDILELAAGVDPKGTAGDKDWVGNWCSRPRKRGGWDPEAVDGCLGNLGKRSELPQRSPWQNHGQKRISMLSKRHGMPLVELFVLIWCHVRKRSLIKKHCIWSYEAVRGGWGGAIAFNAALPYAFALS